MALNLLDIKTGLTELGRTFRSAFGRLSGDEMQFIPETERRKAFLVARIHLAILAAVAVWSVAAESCLPAWFIGLPTFYGSWLHHLLSAMQHAGLAEDGPDHRLNSRTV